MHTLRNRGVALVLVPFLLADPFWTFAPPASSSVTSHPIHSIKNQQALVARLIASRWLGHRDFSSAQRILTASQRQLLPIPSPMYIPLQRFLLHSMDSHKYLSDRIAEILINNNRLYNLTAEDLKLFEHFSKLGGPKIVYYKSPQTSLHEGFYVIRRHHVFLNTLEIFPQTFDDELATISLDKQKVQINPFGGAIAKALLQLDLQEGKATFGAVLSEIHKRMIGVNALAAHIMVYICPDPFLDSVEETLVQVDAQKAEIHLHPINFEPPIPHISVHGFQDLLVASIGKGIANLRTRNREQALATFLLHFTRSVGIARARQVFKLPGIRGRFLLDLYNTLLREAAPGQWGSDFERFPAPQELLPHDAIMFGNWLQSNIPKVVELTSLMYERAKEIFGEEFFYNPDGSERIHLPIPVGERLPLKKQRHGQHGIRTAA